MTEGNGYQKYDIPEPQTMQEFAIRFLLSKKCDGPCYTDDFLFDRVVIGCPRTEHLIEAIDAADKVTAQ